jgi:hypothetical protein
MRGVFSKWQPRYAERGIATFPVSIVGKDKVPMVRGYQRIGSRHSTELTKRFGDASALGFALGRSGITLVDLDARDERVLADALSTHGDAPIIARTASGGFHVWYRSNERAWAHYGKRTRRAVKPDLTKPIDYLAAGFAVLPPSVSEGGRYEFIRGNLDDIGALKPLGGIVPAKVREIVESDIAPELYRHMREGDGRNNTLFGLTLPAAKSVHRDGGTFEQLMDIARRHNSEFGQPLENTEMEAVAASTWKITVEGRNRTGQHGAYLPYDVVAKLVGTCNDALVLLNWLKANEGPKAFFWIANGLAPRIGLSRKGLSAAREQLIELRYIRVVRRAWPGYPAIYTWHSQ